MCGIAGVVAWDENYRVTREQLQRMADALAHRGPDGEGFYLNFEDRPITPDNPQCGFAFRRLAIIDPDPRSNQPFTIGHLTLVFNGEIYNYRELRAEISRLRPDHEWRTQGDVEVLLMSYAVWGERCVEHLNGMFAFAVWDDQKKELFLARDRMGQKPLFYWRPSPGRAIAFASELATLHAFAPVPAEVDQYQSLYDYLLYGWVGEGRTIYRSVRSLPPGHHGTVDEQQAKFDRYFDPNATSAGPASAGPKSIRDMMTLAVQRQLVSDVPLGVLLSGGIDSSIVTACARRAGPVQTFSIGYDDPRYDESGCAESVASHLKTQHHTFRVRHDSVDSLARLSVAFGEPFADSSALPTSALARETRALVKVALGGDGGDELFGGYDRYRAMRVAVRLGAYVPRAIARLAPAFTSGHRKSRITRAARLLASIDEPAFARYAGFLKIFPVRLANELLAHRDPRDDSLHDIVELEFVRHLDHRADVCAALATDRMTYLPYDLLTKVDRCSMLHGLEVRSPFMDHELVQLAAGLTTDQLLKGGPKRMLREAFAKDLPEFVFKRPKMGFAVPIGEWFRGELRSMLRENLFASDSFGKQHFNMKVVERLVEEHESQRVDHSQRLYALLMLELWWRWHRSV